MWATSENFNPLASRVLLRHDSQKLWHTSDSVWSLSNSKILFRWDTLGIPLRCKFNCTTFIPMWATSENFNPLASRVLLRHDSQKLWHTSDSVWSLYSWVQYLSQCKLPVKTEKEVYRFTWNSFWSQTMGHTRAYFYTPVSDVMGVIVLILCVCVCPSVLSLSRPNRQTYRREIWHGGQVVGYLGQILRSRS